MNVEHNGVKKYIVVNTTELRAAGTFRMPEIVELLLDSQQMYSG
jgi:hypothetical protein